MRNEEIIPVPHLDSSGDIGDIAPVPDELAPELGRKRRNKRKVAPEQPTAPIAPNTPAVTAAEVEVIAGAFALGFRVLFDAVASRRGQHWTLGEGEDRTLAIPWATALAPWLVSGSKYMPFAMAALATVGVVLPRIQHDARLVGSLPVIADSGPSDA